MHPRISNIICRLIGTCRNTPTVRYAFPVMALSALFMGIAAVSSQNASYVVIETTPTSVKSGEIFYINVRTFAHTPINAVDIVLTYPESQIEVENIDIGTSVITLWTEEPYAQDGSIYLRGGVFQKGFLGEHTIARVRARAIAEGSAQVAVEETELIAGDGKGTVVRAVESDKGITKIYVTAKDGALESSAVVALVTDIDGNGAVDFSDISAFMSAWFTKSKTFDFNQDGKMTFRDFSILLADSFLK
jgi:hypothetical protein